MEMKIPQLHFDVEIFREVQKEKFKDALKEFGELLIKEMQFQIDRNGDASGLAEWRENLKNDLEFAFDESINETISGIVGLPYSWKKDDYQSMRAFVIAYGTGYRAKGGGEPMRAKPGQMVWDHILSRKNMSEAKNNGVLPDHYNRPPTDFIDIAVRNLRLEYEVFIDTRKDEIVAAAMKESLRFE